MNAETSWGNMARQSNVPSRPGKSPASSADRRGVSAIEMLVAAVLLMTVMSFATTLMFRINRVWSAIGQHRVAAMELSNQLEQLTRLSRDEVALAIKNLQPSDSCRRTLSEPLLVGTVSADALGTRIELQLNWQRLPPGSPLILSGWLTSSPTAPADASQSTALPTPNLPSAVSPETESTEPHEDQP